MKATLISDAKKEIDEASNTSQLKKLYKKYLGPGGLITRELLRIPSLHTSLQKAQSKSVNSIHKTFLSLYEKKKGELE